METSPSDHTHSAKYGAIMRLIALWQDFEQEHGASARLEEFCGWMDKQLRSQPEKHDAPPLAAISENVAPAQAFLAGGALSHIRTDADGTISILIGRMWRFAKMYVKKAFEGQSIASVDEFALVAAIMKHGQAHGDPTKSEVYAATLTEVTTGAEIMRRLEKSGLLEEYTDIKDKRMKRVRLTSRGTGAFFQAAQQMGAASRIVVGTLNEAQKQELIRLLTLLDSFHSTMYAEHRTESFTEIGTLASLQREQDAG